MKKREFTERTEALINQILPQAGKLVLDIGNVNDLLIEIRKRKAEFDKDDDSPEVGSDG
jgi:hypothetical protein